MSIRIGAIAGEGAWKWLLAMVFIAFFLLNSFVLRDDTVYPHYDAAGFAATAYDFVNQLSDGNFPVSTHPTLSPPLYEYVLMGTAVLLGRSVDMLPYANVPFTMLLFFGMHGIMKRIASPAMGFLAVVICISMPTVFGQSRGIWHEYPLMCMITMSYYLLLKSNCFMRGWYVFWWAMSIAGALLIKSSTVIYVMFPVLLYCIYALYVSDRKALVVRRVLFSVLLVIVLASWWYVPNIEYLYGKYSNFFVLDNVTVGPFACFTIALRRLCDEGMYVPLFILFMCSLPFLFFGISPEKLVIAGGILFPLAAHVFSSDSLGFDSVKYYLPVLPLIAMSIANLVQRVRYPAIQRVVYVLVGALCIGQVVIVHAGLRGILQYDNEWRRGSVYDDIVNKEGRITPIHHPVVPQEFWDAIMRTKQTDANVLFLLNHQQLESFFRIEKERVNSDINFYPLAISAYEHQLSGEVRDEPGLLAEYEFVISLGDRVVGVGGCPSHYMTEVLPNILDAFNRTLSGYERVATAVDDSGYEIILFRKFV